MIELGSLQIWSSVQSSFRRQDMPQKTDYKELKSESTHSFKDKKEKDSNLRGHKGNSFIFPNFVPSVLFLRCAGKS